MILIYSIQSNPLHPKSAMLEQFFLVIDFLPWDTHSKLQHKMQVSQDKDTTYK